MVTTFPFAGFTFSQEDCRQIYDFKIYDVTSGYFVEGDFGTMPD